MRTGTLLNPAGPDRRLRELSQGERQMVGDERLSQGPVMGFARSITDSNGRIGFPMQALSTLEAMARNGTISDRQRAAGGEFHRLFRVAALDGLRAADMGRVVVQGGAGDDPVSGDERARRRINAAIQVLGGNTSVTASCAWHVLGLEWSLREFAAKSLRGNVDRASGVLIATLGLLERDFGA